MSATEKAAAKLSVTEVRATPVVDVAGYWQMPFTEDQRYDFNWHDLVTTFSQERERYFRAVLDGDEVARMMLVPVDPTDVRPEFGAPKPRADETHWLEVEWIEVARDHHREGIGMAIIRWLEGAFANRHLIVFGSESADEFWDATGWQRLERSDREVSTAQRPLHVRVPS